MTRISGAQIDGMCLKTLQFIYLSACTTLSFSLVAGSVEGDLYQSVVSWLLGPCVGLLFAFAYPRLLFAAEHQPRRPILLVILHGVIVVTAIIFFCALARFGRNPVSELTGLVAIALLPAFVVLVVAAVWLLLRNRSPLATLASFLLWPYWLGLALVFAGAWFRGNPLYYFLGFLSPIGFAFAGGALPYNRRIALASGLTGLLAGPWLGETVIRDSGLGNVWLVFNVPNNRYGMSYPMLPVWSSILAVGLLVLAVTITATRFLPLRWKVRGAPVCERTWPSVFITLIVVAVWYSQSVMPYRMPGAVDYSDYPGFQILHVEKKGLRFHETCVTVGEGEMRYRGAKATFSVATDNRRLFAYSFTKTHTSGVLTSRIYDRIHAIGPAIGSPRERSDVINPVRDWSADNWYLNVQRDVKIYGTSNGSHPPQEIVDLFHDLQALPQSAEGSSELRDVCMGFCYDPLSAMGYLFANHRCFNDGHGLVCW